jgi:CobQ-like glutamine amidotransferase family enzyme
MKDYVIRIGWLYPELMSTYGDRGNIIYFRNRCHQRGIQTEVVAIDQDFAPSTFSTLDFIFGGGSQDIEQEIVMRDLHGKKAEAMKKRIEENIPALFVCGSPQLMGHYYEPSEGNRIDGIGVFDITSVHPGPTIARCIGNTVGSVLTENLNAQLADSLIIGFENHGGRTHLGAHAKPFAKVIKGYGNNGEDGLEGVVYKNAIGCYYHGPFFCKNPLLADFFIQRIIEVKYDKKIDLNPIENVFETKAREALLKRWNIQNTV